MDTNSVEKADGESRQVTLSDTFVAKKPRPPLAEKIKRQVYDRDGRACLQCGSTTRLSIDHIVPAADGGGDELDNLQVLCLFCNMSKGPKGNPKGSVYPKRATLADGHLYRYTAFDVWRANGEEPDIVKQKFAAGVYPAIRFGGATGWRITRETLDQIADVSCEKIELPSDAKQARDHV